MPETETPLNAREPTVGALPRKRTLLKLDAPRNAEAPILVRLLDPEKVTLAKLDAL
jgi:hypothetical protein